MAERCICPQGWAAARSPDPRCPVHGMPVRRTVQQIVTVQRQPPPVPGTLREVA